MRGTYESGPALPCQGSQLVELFGLVVDLHSVSAAKLLAARETVAEPFRSVVLAMSLTSYYLFYFLVLVNALPE
ncbi:MAG: hypothetical protein ABI150_11410 [Nitrobacter sp.]